MKKSQDHSFYIIAIGASAGSMEEINSFFDHTPMDGVAYVVIQHLSADFKSRMVELLSRHSKLMVLEAENGMKVMSNKVYLIPNDKFMTIHDGKLFLTAKEIHKGPHLTINAFYETLAHHGGSKAIAVILSGLGTDGTEGLKAIKRAGGLAIARNPKTSAFGSMPSSAISTGLVDFVLEPGQMPLAIKDYILHESELENSAIQDEPYLAAIIDLIKRETALDFSVYKQTTIIRRTRRRASFHKFATFEKYLGYLKVTPDEVVALSKDFLISVTSFFRDNDAFHTIQTEIIPSLLKGLEPGEELKLWVAACATGQEAYSIAILIAEQLTGKYKDTKVKIFATDLDTEALAFAGKGVYEKDIVNYVSAERLGKYFIQENEGYKIISGIRKMVIFAQHDLVKNPPYCNMHFISCRNVLIYLAPVLQKKVFSMLLFGLRLHGYLFFGASENPVPIMDSLKVIDKKWRLFKNIKSRRDFTFENFSLPDLHNEKPKPLVVLAETINKTNHPLAEAIGSALAIQENYLAICVDEQNHVLKSFGDTSKFLLQQNFNSNLEQLLPDALLIAYNTLRNELLKTYLPSKVNGIYLLHGLKTIVISLSVSPLTIDRDNRQVLMVTFKEEQTAENLTVKKTVFDDKLFRAKYTRNLEDEVKFLTKT